VQNVQVSDVVVEPPLHTQPVSIAQPESHPSPLIVFPSSHISQLCLNPSEHSNTHLGGEALESPIYKDGQDTLILYGELPAKSLEVYNAVIGIYKYNKSTLTISLATPAYSQYK
jgi:hypothetical protein